MSVCFIWACKHPRTIEETLSLWVPQYVRLTWHTHIRITLNGDQIQWREALSAPPALTQLAAMWTTVALTPRTSFSSSTTMSHSSAGVLA